MICRENTLLIGFLGPTQSALTNQLNADGHRVLWLPQYKQMLLAHLSEPIINQAPILNSRVRCDNFLMFAQLSARRGTFYNNYPALRDEFVLLQRIVYEYLINEKIDNVFFSNIPHEGCDYVFYIIALQLDLKIRVCFQSIFNNRFFIVDRLEDFGYFKRVPQWNFEKLTVDGFRRQGLTYMTGVKGFSTPWQRLRKRAENMMRRLSPEKVRSVFDTQRFRHRILRVLESFEFPNYIKRVRQTLCYKRRDIDSSYDYVYFALQLQPELTTAMLGGPYDDQLRALEELANTLPSRYKILVKENPKQSARYRGLNWFKRLNAIGKVVPVDGRFSSTELIDLSRVVASVTGTVGWEALISGKPCIYFGQPWYASFRYAYSFEEVAQMGIEHLESIEAESILQSAEESLGELSSIMPQGIVDAFYSNTDPTLSVEENARKLKDVLTYPFANDLPRP